MPARWTPRYKAEIVKSILDGALTTEQAAAMVGPDCSVAEIESWVLRYEAGGDKALRVTQHWRQRS